MKRKILIVAGSLGALVFACFFGFLLALVGDESASETVEVEVTRQVEVEVTRLVEVSEEGVPLEVTRLVEVEVTRIVEIEVVADVPEPASAPSGAAFEPKQAGIYLAGVDMAPGIWRSSGTPDSDGECTLKIMDLGGEITDLSYMPVGVSHRIPSGDFQIVISEYGDQCTWTWISE